VEYTIERRVSDKICNNWAVIINLFDQKSILKQGKCRLSPSIQVINSAEKSGKKLL
jgi:hypothetical protein